MTDDPWAALRGSGLVVPVPAGAPVFEQGDAADGAYVVLSGSCAVLENRDRVGLLAPGDLFGEIGAFGTGTRSASVVAVEDAELLYLSLDQLREGFARSPDLFWSALRLVVSRLREVVARQVAYREEHKGLREVQRSLLPDLTALDPAAGFTADARWQPCTYASGDFYDVVRVDADRHVVVIGDVMGHGAEASLMMAVARAQLHELVRHFRRTDELLLSLDGYLRDNGPTRQGLSLFVGCYDHGRRTLEYSVAGHPFPLLVRDGEATPLPGRPGIVLALPVMIGSGYQRHLLPLEDGDRVLLFTDGLFELGTSGAQLGTEGLAALVAKLLADGTTDLLDRLFDTVEVLAAGPADDDRTALLLEF